MRHIRIVAVAVAFCNAGFGALHVSQLIQAPAQRGQTLNSLTADAGGNLIVTGSGVQGGFVTKLDPTGTMIFTFANFGAYPTGAAVDKNGDIIWIGSAGAPGFPFPFTKTILAVAQTGSRVPGFVVKFEGTSGHIIWAAEIQAMQPQAIAMDATGAVTLAGPATVAPGVTSSGAYQSPAAGTVAPLAVVRITPDGDPVFAATYGGHFINGTSTCVSNPFLGCLSDPRVTAASVLIDSRGDIWVAGSTNETDLPVTTGALKAACGCSLSSGDGYLAQFSADGSKLLYATYLGTSTQGADDTAGNDVINSAAMDNSDHIWLAGSTNGADLPTTPDAVQTSLIGDQDGFVLEYDPATKKLTYGTYYGTQQSNGITAIAINADGLPVLAGYLNSNPSNPYNFGNDFVAVLEGSSIDVSPFLRNAADAGLALMPSGSLLIAGSGNVIAVTDDGAGTPSIFGVANSASLNASGQLSAGEIITLVGTELGPVTPIAAKLTGEPPSFPSTLGGVQVLIGGVPAPLLYVSSNQINAIVPFGVAGAPEAGLIVENNGVSSGKARLGVAVAAPAVFTTQEVNQYLPVAAALNQNGTINSATNRAAPGSIVSVFASGFGALSSTPPDGSILSGALPVLQQNVDLFGPGFVSVLYAGPAPGLVAGAMQLNFQIPVGVTQTPTMLLFVGAISGPPFTVWVSGT